jgi:hypothetical protein
MGTKIKVQGGTLVEGESLCRTCRFAHIQRGFRQSEEVVFCGYETMRVVRFKIAECTDYLDKTVPTRYEMDQMAYLINVEPARKRSGFVSAVGFSAKVARDEDGESDELDSMVHE